jgi:hypothetical protein
MTARKRDKVLIGLFDGRNPCPEVGDRAILEIYNRTHPAGL